jgi:hypothetical protein
MKMKIKMKMKKVNVWKKSGIETGSLIFCLLLGLVCVNSFAQKISVARYTYYISNVGYEVVQCYIKNDTNEEMLLWLEKDTIIQKMSIEDKVKNYFFMSKGERPISFFHIINDFGSTATVSSISLFFTFYKLIEPQKTFTIQVICKIPYKKDTVRSLKKMITTVIPSQLEEARLNIFQMSRYGFEEISFKPNTLVIDGQNIGIHL